MPDTLPARAAGHLDGLDGLRAVAALGVLTTHVAFQTGTAATPVLGPALGRLDLAVAVFFALSGFLLWRPWAAAAATGGPHPAVGPYALHRAARVLPAYLVLVVAVLWLLPENHGTSTSTWLANLTLTQVFVPLTLAPGLSHLWSLSVEAAFYLALPLLGLALLRVRGRARVVLVVALGVLSLGWSSLRAAAFPGVQADLWLPAQLPWFLVGVVLAELVLAPPRWLRLAAARAWVPLTAAAVAFALASTPLGGPALLDPPSPLQAATKTALGAVVAAGLLAPLVLGTTGGRYRRALTTGPARVLGRWSYGLFLWHLAVLAVAFPLLGVPVFSGHAVLVWVTTVVLSVPVAAASYALVEEPVRLAARRFERDRRGRASTPVESSAASTSS